MDDSPLSAIRCNPALAQFRQWPGKQLCRLGISGARDRGQGRKSQGQDRRGGSPRPSGDFSDLLRRIHPETAVTPSPAASPHPLPQGGEGCCHLGLLRSKMHKLPPALCDMYVAGRVARTSVFEVRGLFLRGTEQSTPVKFAFSGPKASSGGQWSNHSVAFAPPRSRRNIRAGSAGPDIWPCGFSRNRWADRERQWGPVSTRLSWICRKKAAGPESGPCATCLRSL